MRKLLVAGMAISGIAMLAGCQKVPVALPSSPVGIQEDHDDWDCARDGNKICGNESEAKESAKRHARILKAKCDVVEKHHYYANIGPDAWAHGYGIECYRYTS